MELGPRRVALQLFLHRLEARSTLSVAEREALLALRGRPQKVAAHRDFVRQGEELKDACLIVDGLAARFVQLEDGSRQIISLHVPGDMADLDSLLLPRAPSPLHALTNTTIIKVPHEALRAVASEHQNLSTAFWRDCVADGTIMAQWLVNVGHKNARARIAHLLAEMAVRYAHVGMLKAGHFPLAITQEQIGDALGLTSVHVNRSIKTLRDDKLIQMSRSGVQVLDWRGLTLAGEFNPDYLDLRAALVDLDTIARRQAY